MSDIDYNGIQSYDIMALKRKLFIRMNGIKLENSVNDFHNWITEMEEWIKDSNVK